MKFSSSAITFLTYATVANGHGHLKSPEGPEDMTNIDTYGDHWYNQGSMIGCPTVNGDTCDVSAPCCENPMKPTLLDTKQLTYRSEELWSETEEEYAAHSISGKRHLRRGLTKKDFVPSVESTPFKFNPWLAPGHAPVAESCGILGGWRYRNAEDYIAGPGNAEKFRNGIGGPTNTFPPPADMNPVAGTLGTSVLERDLDKRMQEAQGQSYVTNDNLVWKAGETQNVSYTLVANHGGGIQYRICPVEYLLNNTLSEECFKPLEFSGNKGWFQYTIPGSNDSSSVEFTPVLIDESNTGDGGVLPKGSTWTQVPLPACAYGFGVGKHNETECDKPMFENEISDAGFYGFVVPFLEGSNSEALKELDGAFEIVNTIKVPEGRSGDFVLSWRWDSEQTPQVWTQCAIITIEDGESGSGNSSTSAASVASDIVPGAATTKTVTNEGVEGTTTATSTETSSGSGDTSTSNANEIGSTSKSASESKFSSRSNIAWVATAATAFAAFTSACM